MQGERLSLFKDITTIVSAVVVSVAVFTLSMYGLGQQRTRVVEVPHKECQELIIRVDKQADVLAHCPSGTYIDIIDDHVVCRCGKRIELPNIIVLPDDPSPELEHNTSSSTTGGHGISL